MASPKKEENSPHDLLEMPGVETKSVILEAKEVSLKTVEPEAIKPTEKKIETPVKEKTEKVKTEDQSLFPTEFYLGLGIAVCGKCGSKKLTDEHGVICAIGSKECPLIG